METKLIGKSTTIFEVAEDTAKYNGSPLSESFKDFLRSLGFDVKNRFNTSESEHVTIDGEDFCIEYSAGSFLAKDSFRKEWKPRKNRCIELFASNYQSKLAAKILFNIEIDRLALIKKIKKAIEKELDIKKMVADRESNKKLQLNACKIHYLTPENKKHISSIYVGKGLIEMHTIFGKIYINVETNSFQTFIPQSPEAMDLDGIDKWVENTEKSRAEVINIVSSISRLEPIGESFTEFAKGANHEQAYYNDLNKK